jgi:TATA-box binding protein (TBP) (component of TFIID and TFIIIB)
MESFLKTQLGDLPESMQIFVITMTCKVDKQFYIDNILEYYPLSENNIQTIKSKLKIRDIKNKKPKSKKTNINFYNQITTIMSIPVDYNSDKTKLVNIKIFNNGSIQISGLQSINQCNITLNKLLDMLKGDYAYLDDNKLIDIRFVESDDINIIDTKINMINTMFEYETQINRAQLYNRLLALELGTRIKYQPEIHAPVHVKIDVGNKKPATIFIFESGKILIMGARNRDNIIECFEYITKLLNENQKYIVKRDLLQIISTDKDLSSLIDLVALKEIIHEF